MLINFINIWNQKIKFVNINPSLYNNITFSSDEVSIDYGNKVQVLKYNDYVIKDFVYDKEYKTDTDVYIEKMIIHKFKSFSEYTVEKYNENGGSLNNINEELGILGN